jgi:DNA-binding beta-propeller fold protein YncE
VYVCEYFGNRVQKFTSNGVYLAQWGTPGSGDGQFSGMSGIGHDGSGNIYVSENGNSRVQVFTNGGAFLTKWGTPGSGNGQFSYPAGNLVDGSGNVYVVENFNARVQKFGQPATPTTSTSWGRVKALYR